MEVIQWFQIAQYLTKDGEITHNPNAFFSMHSMSMKIAENRSCAF